MRERFRGLLSDPASDGSSNCQEYLTSNDPTNPKSFFRPTVRLADGLLLVAFPTVAGHSYTIESSTNLTTWTAQGTIFVSATGSRKSTPASASRRRTMRSIGRLRTHAGSLP